MSKLGPEVSPNTRQRQSQEIRQKYAATSILHAAMMVQAELGHDLAKQIHKLLIDDPESNGKRLMDGLSSTTATPVKKLSKLQAVSFLLHNNLIVDHYKAIKRTSDNCNAGFLPCYDHVLEAKEECRPAPEGVTITETEAVIPLKSMGIHSVSRILKIPRVQERISIAKAASGKENFKVKAIIKGGNDT